MPRAGGEGHAGVPFTESQRLPRRDDDRQRGHRAARAKRLGQASEVVFGPDRPAERDRRGRQTGERALEMAVDAFAEPGERGRDEALAAM
jgi:hypothetical protein